MNVINLKVDFEKRTIKQTGVNLTSGDYNSTKLVFEFDNEYQETKICEIAKKEDTEGNNEAIFVEEIINNEVVLGALADIKNDNGYIKYKDSLSNIYWYDEENLQLYDNEGNTSSVELETLTKVQQSVSIFDEAGKYVLEVSLYGEDSKLTSAFIDLTVKPGMVRVGDEKVSQYIPIFDTLMNQAVTLIDELETAEETIETAETTRQSNETARQNAETTRQGNEAIRQANETERISAETSRASAEATRTSNESSRQSAENSRASAEEDRETAEQNRASTFESLLEDAEEIIGDLEEELIRRNNEETRKSNENTRISNETARESAEEDRETAETARAEAEIIRNTNETNRTSAEAGRVAEESSRVSAEQARESAETARTSNEETRQNNESARTSNETTRQSNEQTRQTNEESRSTAEEAREDAETERSTAESTRVSNETTRQSNEETRQSNEEAREEAEEIREAKIVEFEEEIERLRANTPKGTTNTNPAYINDSADLPLNKFVLGGKTEQFSTTGKQLFDFSKVIADDVANGTLLEKYSNGVKVAGTDAQADSMAYARGWYRPGDAYNSRNCRITVSEQTTLYVSADVTLLSQVGLAETRIYLLGTTSYTTSAVQNLTLNQKVRISKSITVEAGTYHPAFPLDGNTLLIENIMISTSEDTTYEPYTGGIPSPSPTYPQEIRNVEGKNIYNLKKHLTDRGVSYTENADGSLTFNLTNSLNTNPFQFSSKDIDVSLSGIITSVTSNNVRLNLLNSNNEYVSRINESTLKTENKNACKIQFDWTSMGTVTMKNIMLNKDATAQPYVPYNCIQIKKCNKNLLPDENFRFGYISNPNGVFVVDQYNIVSDYIKIDNSKTYTISFNRNLSPMAISEFDKDKNFIRKRENYQSNISLTFSKTTKYIIVGGSVGNTTMSKELWLSLNPQLEEGSTATPYVPHLEKTYNFPLSEGQKLMQDGKIEDNVVNEWGEVVFNGTETWEFEASTSSPVNRSVIRLANRLGNKNQSFLSNNFIYNKMIDGNSLTLVNSIYLSLSDELSGITNQDDNTTKLTKLKMWLSNNPTIVQYPLATPDETPFTPEQQAVIDEIISDGTYKEVTHYTAEASLNPDMEIGYYKDMDSIVNKIENLDSRLSLLE